MNIKAFCKLGKLAAEGLVSHNAVYVLEALEKNLLCMVTGAVPRNKVTGAWH
jgi:hypothetical protein